MSIGRYFVLKQELEFTKYRLDLELRDLNKNKPNDYLKYKSVYDEQDLELNLLRTKFEKNSLNAENIRFEMIRILDGCSVKVKKMLQRGYYPSLDQGMTIQGYIFGKVREALLYTVKCEGKRGFVPQMYMSTESWDYKTLLEALAEAKSLLEQIKFYSIKDALEWHEKIQNKILINHKKAIGYLN